jgi:serine/threonine protein kinase
MKPSIGTETRLSAPMDATRIATVDDLSTRQSPTTMRPLGRFGPGDMIGDRYEVLAVHGGMMGVVYACVNEKTNQPVALKTLQEHFTGDVAMRRLFADEASTWVSLGKHPSIVRAYYVEVFSSLPYVVTEYVRGREGMGSDLRSWIGHPRLSLVVAVEMALNIAQAMAYAADRVPDLVHRDLKPANILVDFLGRPRVTDFGLVRAQQSDAGTPMYMAPEQWEGGLITPQTDMYAFGCILFEMVTAHRLFAAESEGQWKDAHLNLNPTHPAQFSPTVPKELSDLVLCCLEKHPSKRPESWSYIVDKLAACFYALTGQPAVGTPTESTLDANELVLKAYSLSLLGKNKEAIQACDQALQLDKNNSEALLLLGNNKLILHSKFVTSNVDKKEILALFEQITQKNPDNGFAWVCRARALAQLGYHKEASKAFERAYKLDGNDCSILMAYACDLRNRGHVEKSLAYFDRAIKLDPGNSTVWTCMGDALASLGRYDDARMSFKRSISLDPGEDYAVKMVDLLHGEFYSDCIDPAHWVKKAWDAFWERRFDCMKAIDRAIALDRDNVEAWELKIKVLRATIFNDADTLAAIDRVLELNPYDAMSWSEKASCLWGLGRQDEAIQAIDKAIEEDTIFTPEYKKKKVELLKALGRTDEAEILEMEALYKAPGNPKPSRYAVWEWIVILFGAILLATWYFVR